MVVLGIYLWLARITFLYTSQSCWSDLTYRKKNCQFDQWINHILYRLWCIEYFYGYFFLQVKDVIRTFISAECWAVLLTILMQYNRFFEFCNYVQQVLCKSYPSEFISYFHYCRSLRFEDKPDYSYLKRLFRDLFIREGKCIWLGIYIFNSSTPDLFHYILFPGYCGFLYSDMSIFSLEAYCVIDFCHRCRLSIWLCFWLDCIEVSTDWGQF